MHLVGYHGNNSIIKQITTWESESLSFHLLSVCPCKLAVFLMIQNSQRPSTLGNFLVLFSKITIPPNFLLHLKLLLVECWSSQSNCHVYCFLLYFISLGIYCVSGDIFPNFLINYFILVIILIFKNVSYSVIAPFSIFLFMGAEFSLHCDIRIWIFKLFSVSDSISVFSRTGVFLLLPSFLLLFFFLFLIFLLNPCYWSSSNVWHPVKGHAHM